MKTVEQLWKRCIHLHCIFGRHLPGGKVGPNSGRQQCDWVHDSPGTQSWSPEIRNYTVNSILVT
jgi:hypothetical protein